MDQLAISVPEGGDLWIIASPLSKLRAKYYLEGAGTGYPSVDFDLYAAQRRVNAGWNNRVEAADLYATLLMNSAIRKMEVDAVMRRASAIDALLEEVPDDELAHCDLASIEKPLLQLLATFRRAGLGVAKTMKLLCLKRPKLLPMLDSQVILAIHGHLPSFNKPPGAFARLVLDSVKGFRDLMHLEGNLARLKALSRMFSSEVSVHLVRRGIRTPHPVISPVRVLDNLLWFDWWGHGYFGFRWYKREKTVRRP